MNNVAERIVKRLENYYEGIKSIHETMVEELQYSLEEKYSYDSAMNAIDRCYPVGTNSIPTLILIGILTDEM